MKRLMPIGMILCAAVMAGADKPHGTPNSVGISLVPIAPGSFEMGVDSTPLSKEILAGVHAIQYARPSDQGDYDEKPVHKVTISKAFLIGETEVTVEQYKLFKPDYKGVDYYAPYASGVSWEDAVAYCKWLSEKEGKPYRLPAEAEWEYVVRAGRRELFAVAAAETQPAKTDAANDFGVRNMQSKVAEWCLDWHGMYPRDPQTDPVGPASGLGKVVRGGGLDRRVARNDDGGNRWPADMDYARRSANRASMDPEFRTDNGNIGFRVVQAEMPRTAPLPADPLFFSTAIKQTVQEITRGPDEKKPYYHARPMFPNINAVVKRTTTDYEAKVEVSKEMREIGWNAGLAPALGSGYHNSAVQVLANGDIVAAYYNTPEYEDDPDQTVLSMRLRYGSDEWDMPEPWPNFCDSADAAPIFWNDKGKLWMFFGSPRLMGGPPFWFMTSMDNGASWSPAHMPVFDGPVGTFTSQPISSTVRDASGTIYLPVDGQGSVSVLSATSDEGKTWRDTGGRTGGRHTALVLGKDGSIMGFGGKESNINGFMPLSVTRDGGKTYEKTPTEFGWVGGGQRPSAVRLASGRIFFVCDVDRTRTNGAIVALSDDEGKTWHKRMLPGVNTAGYCTATQAPNGLIHIVTSKTLPAPLQIELNEAWVLAAAETPNAEYDSAVKDVKAYSENYPSGKVKATWSGGLGGDGSFHLQGLQTFFYEDGKKQIEAAYASGKKIGMETYWNADGTKKWEKDHAADGTWTWRLFDGNQLVAESKWKDKNLVSAKIEK